MSFMNLNTIISKFNQHLIQNQNETQNIFVVINPDVRQNPTPDLKLRNIELINRKDVDIAETIKQRETESSKLDYVNDKDPTFRLKFANMPVGIVRILLKSDCAVSDFVLTDPSPFLFQETNPRNNFSDAFLHALIKSWPLVPRDDKRKIIIDFKKMLWQEFIAQKLFIKNGYSTQFSLDEFQFGLSTEAEGALVNRAYIASLQDIFKINIILYEQNKSDYNTFYIKNKSSLKFHPYLIFIYSDHDGYRCLSSNLETTNFSPFILLSKYEKLIDCILEGSLPETRQNFGINLNSYRLENLKQIADMTSISVSKLKKNELIDVIHCHKFSDDEIDRIRHFLREKHRK